MAKSKLRLIDRVSQLRELLFPDEVEQRTSAPFAITGGVQTLPQSAEIVAGRIYAYEQDWLITNATAGSLQITAGYFSTSGGPATSSHARVSTRLGANSAVFVDDTSFSTNPGTVTLPAGSINIVLARGIIVCTGSGTITPRVNGTGTMTLHAGARFFIKAVG